MFTNVDADAHVCSCLLMLMLANVDADAYFLLFNIYFTCTEM